MGFHGGDRRRGGGDRGRGGSGRAARGGGNRGRGHPGGLGRGRDGSRGSSSNVKWEPWQRELHLPDREPGSAGLISLEFACFRCATTIVTGDQIFRLGDPDSDKNTGPGTKGLLNCLFTNCLPDTLIVAGKPFWNDSKGCFIKEVFCKECISRGISQPGRSGNNVGTIYDTLELPNECEPDTLGLDKLEKYCKLGHYRTHKKDGNRLQQLVAVGEHVDVVAALAKTGETAQRFSATPSTEAHEVAQLRAQLAQAKAQLAQQERVAQLRGRHWQPEPQPEPAPQPAFRFSCNNCGKAGHKARDCDQPK
eukprot:COSAG02_NODE_5595_length_4200_cov_8.320540_1_plen_306_part_10